MSGRGYLPMETLPYRRAFLVGSGEASGPSGGRAMLSSLECQNPTNASQQKSHRASWAAVRHRKHDLPPHLGELTIHVAINRNAEALHDACNLAK